jgi:hypothetical protein
METNWSLNNVKVYNTLDGNSDVIYLVNYNVIASDDNGNVFTLSKEESIDTSNITDFVPFADLTETIVIGWVKDGLGASGVAEIEQEAINGFDEMLNTSVKTL